jgi:hypothetical protein
MAPMLLENFEILSLDPRRTARAGPSAPPERYLRGLLLADKRESDVFQRPFERITGLVAATTQRVRCIDVDTGPSMLIRPDACVAWAGEHNSIDGLEEALRRWFIPSSSLQ